MDAETEEIITKLIISIVIGTIIGGEREYRNKSAGLRTIVMICLGSTLFTILSAKIGDASGASRVAANIVTGIGFLGAGAIMREGLSISGLTTASTIWVAAALGMAVGDGEYSLAVFTTVGVMLILTGFGYVQTRLFKFLNKTVELHLTMDSRAQGIDRIEGEMIKLQVKFSRKKEFKKEGEVIYQYDLIGKEPRLEKLIHFLNGCDEVKSFDY
jgi:putative Mg2+ transporter-C (MgtC) family protein